LLTYLKWKGKRRKTGFGVKLHHGERQESADVGTLTVLDVRLAEPQKERATHAVLQLPLRLFLRNETVDQPDDTDQEQQISK